MAKVLVAEDEQRGREYLAGILARDGQEVRSAATGREAIDIGSKFRPDVLVADWMLKNHINGLHVSKVLRAVNHDLRTILVSGLPSRMFSDQLLASDVFRFFEKPLEVDQLLTSVRSAVTAPRDSVAGSTAKAPGIVEMTPAGDVLYANAKAEDLFGRVLIGRRVGNLSEILSDAEVACLAHDRMRRVAIRYQSGETTHWRICVKRLDDSEHKLVVLLPESDARQLDLESLRMLLGFPEPWHVAWPLKGMTLVVDTDRGSLRLVLAQMRRARAKHSGASSTEEALQVLRNRPRVDLVIVDCALGRQSIRDLLTEVTTHHRDALIVGSSASDADEPLLAELGIANVLRKPWGTCDLLDIVTGRL